MIEYIKSSKASAQLGRASLMHFFIDGGQMCLAVSYTRNGRDIYDYFINPKALLPILTKPNQVNFLPWGRRPYQAGRLPLGGWADLDSIYGGQWERYFPKVVSLNVKAFMEKDFMGKSHWYPLVLNDLMQGLVVKEGLEQRVYVVTISPSLPGALHERWPYFKMTNGYSP